MSGETGWSAPPAAKATAPGEMAAFLAEVKSRSGEWAWRTYKNSSAGTATGTALRRKGFETRWVGSELRLYVRWPVEVKS
jgi:hypothetical protein